MDATGQTITDLDENALRTSIDDLRDFNLDVVVVSFLNAYVNPEHEHRAAEIIQQAGVAQQVVAATDVSAEMREFERTSTAAINAYVSRVFHTTFTN